VEIGNYIAENMLADPSSKVLGLGVAELLGIDKETFMKLAAHDLFNKITGSQRTQATLLQGLTKILGEDNLIGSSGEFGLLLAFLSNSPHTTKVNGEPAFAIADMAPIFGANGVRAFPDGWDTWRKTSLDWVIHTTMLSQAALVHYVALCQDPKVPKQPGTCQGVVGVSAPCIADGQPSQTGDGADCCSAAGVDVSGNCVPTESP
jgi:hypothetical protein